MHTDRLFSTDRYQFQMPSLKGSDRRYEQGPRLSNRHCARREMVSTRESAAPPPPPPAPLIPGGGGGGGD
jgi:hypothetical protein